MDEAEHSLCSNPKVVKTIRRIRIALKSLFIQTLFTTLYTLEPVSYTHLDVYKRQT